jgi:hypothetical protein
MNRNLYLRVLRVLPSFVLLALGGCAIGTFMFHIPSDQLAVAVSVPLVLMFSISRVLVLIVPREPPPEEASVPRTAAILILGAGLLSFLAIIDFALSAAIFHGLGLATLASEAVKIAGVFLVGLLASIAVAICRSAMDSIDNLIEAAIAGGRDAFWDIAIAPTKLADRCFRHSSLR